MKEQILEMIIDICDEEAICEDLDADLFELGLLDSLGVVSLLIAFEDKLGVKFAPTAIDKSQISSVNKIFKLLEDAGLKL